MEAAAAVSALPPCAAAVQGARPASRQAAANARMNAPAEPHPVPTGPPDGSCATCGGCCRRPRDGSPRGPCWRIRPTCA